jgi:CPA1 family monovalent cation:H+ antiporter
LCGLALTWLKYLLVRWLRLLGMENVTLHILINLLTPFLIYMTAEAMSVSGILAVFAAGIVHSFMREKFNPETVRLDIAQESVWSVLSFTFDGLVFVMLGVQLPGILATIGSRELPIGGWAIAGCVLLLTLLFIALRFVWWIAAVRKKTYQEPDQPLDAVKAGMIFSLAGARGAVTLASVMSIPLILDDGSAFPERDLIILLASGVIIVSLLITNFVMPLLAKRKTKEARSQDEQTARAEIIQTVIARLLAEATEETRLATGIVINSYAKRSAAHMGRFQQNPPEERELRRQTLLWEKENTLALALAGRVRQDVANHFLEVLTTRAEEPSDREGGAFSFFQRILWFLAHILRLGASVPRKKGKRRDGEKPSRGEFTQLMTANTRYVLERLSAIKDQQNSAMVEKLTAEFELSAALIQSRAGGHNPGARPGGQAPLLDEVAAKGFRIERGLIQEMFEAGRVSWESAREMRGAIAALEGQLQADADLA